MRSGRRRIRQGKTKLDYRDRELAFLPSLLAELDVNVDSQLLCLEARASSGPGSVRRDTRAIYFNDDVFVGHGPHREVEARRERSTEGVTCYTLEATRSRDREIRRRETEYANARSQWIVRGLVAHPVFPDAAGNPLFLPGLTPPPPITPRRSSSAGAARRLTGQLGSLRHMGNVKSSGIPDTSTELEAGGHAESHVSSWQSDLRTYPAQTSHLIALMTFEHQLHVQPDLANRSARSRGRKKPTADGPEAERLNATIEETLRYMLFVEEARLPEPIVGVSRFTSTFPARGPRDSRGRSLRDFDLSQRLFRFPLS